MTTTTISKLVENQRSTICGVVSDVRVTEKNILCFDVEDLTGTISGRGFQEAADVFYEHLKKGGTFTFNRVEPRPNRLNGALEFKLYHNSSVVKCDVELKIPRTFVSVSEALSSGSPKVYIKAFVCAIGAPETDKNSEPLQRCVLKDSSGEVKLFMQGNLVGDAALVEGGAVEVEARVGNKNSAVSTSLFATRIHSSSDAGLLGQKDSILAEFKESAAKKSKAASLVSIEEISKTPIGDRVIIEAVVRSEAIPTPVANGERVKHDFVVVDKSMHSIVMTVFSDKGVTLEASLGVTVTATATVRDYNTRSLLVNVDALRQKDLPDLKTWYSQLPSDVVFTSLSGS